MIVDFKCENEKCKNYNKVEERYVKYEELNNQKCEACGHTMVRVWGGGSTSIRTSDGYKQ